MRNWKSQIFVFGFFHLIHSLKEHENDNFRFAKDALHDFKHCVLDGIYCI